MKFLCDVHISIKLVKQLEASGYSSMHVNQMTNKWHTSDVEICTYADNNDFVVITKDTDFSSQP